MKKLEEFKVLPKLVGIWKGHWIALDAQGKEIYQFTSLLTQKIVNNQWVQTNENKYSDGRKETLHFLGKVLGNNSLLLESSDAPYSDFKMIVDEHREHLIIISVSEKKTDSLLATETINLVSPKQRIRTLQQFKSPNGQLRGFTLVNEQKID